MSKKHPITAYRESENLSIGDLAAKLKVSRETVWRWENGKRRPDDKLLPVVSRLTKIPIAVLMNLEAAA